MDIVKTLEKARIIPVAVLENADDACRVVELLLKHDLPVIEITLRTEKALSVIETVAREFPAMLTGAGSVLTGDALKSACDSGARFAVSPGLDTGVLDQARAMGVPFVPGIATPSELMKALEFGPVVKVFPAAALGGVEYINAITAPFKMREVCLMPTGGVNASNFPEYLKADRVIACGMTYIVDAKLLRDRNFSEMESRISDAVKRARA